MKDNDGIYRGLGGTKGGLGSKKKLIPLPHEFFELTAKIESEQNPNAYYVVLTGGAEHQRLATDTINEAKQACLDYIASNNLSPSEWTGGQLFEDGEKVGLINHEGINLDPGPDADDQDGGPSPR